MNKKLFFVVLLLSTCWTTILKAQDQYIGEIRMFAGNFAPTGWMKCEGQLLPIAQYSALFSVLGTAYGGNGINTFALPDFRGRVPMSTGSGPGLTQRSIGETGGEESTTLTIGNMPAHNHALSASSASGTSSDPTNNYPAHTGAVDKEYSSTTNTTMGSTQAAGNNLPVNNVQPFQCVTFIIAIQGIYPTQ